MSELDLALFFVTLCLAAGVVFSSLNLARRPAPTLHRSGRRSPSSLPSLLSPGFRPGRQAAARHGGQIREYLGKLGDYEPIATDEEIATPRGAVAIPMAIAVRGEVRVLYPVESPLSAERIDETLRHVALIRRHRFPEARIAFLSERALPLDLALCASADNALGRLVSHSVLHLTELREGRDDATVFREVFQECTGEPLSYSASDLGRVDAFLQRGEPVSGPITPGLRRLGTLLGRYIEWVMAGEFADRLVREQGKVSLRLEGGDLELDLTNLSLEALYSGGRLSLAALLRELRELDRDPFHIPREVSPANLQRWPTHAELARYRRPVAIESALAAFKAHRVEMLRSDADVEEIAQLYVCQCGNPHLVYEPFPDAPCRSLPELEARLWDALQAMAASDTVRCSRCQGLLTARQLALLTVAHPMTDRGVDLWVTLDRLPSGKFWWHLTRLRRGGDITHYAGVLSPSVFSRAFGRFFSVKEAWTIVFQRMAATLREEKLHAEPGLTLHAAPEGLRPGVPPRPRTVGVLSPAFVIPLTREIAGSGSEESFLMDERELRGLSGAGPTPVAWVVARARPFRKMWERELQRLGGTYERRGLEYLVRSKDGGESWRDLEQAIKKACLRGADYLSAARVLAREALAEASQVKAYVDRAREVLGAGPRFSYVAERGVLEVGLEGLKAPKEIQLASLMSKTSLMDGSFERYLKMAIAQSDLGVGLDVCGCGARAFVSKKVKPRDWQEEVDLARRIQGPVSFIYTRDCREHAHYLSQAELKRFQLTLDDLERCFERDLAENAYNLTLRVVRVESHLFFTLAGFNVASIALSGSLVKGLLDAAKIELDVPSVRFLASTTGSLAIGEPEAPASAFREAAKLAEGLLKETGEPFDALRFEGVLAIPEIGRGGFTISK